MQFLKKFQLSQTQKTREARDSAHFAISPHVDFMPCMLVNNTLNRPGKKGSCM